VRSPVTKRKGKGHICSATRRYRPDQPFASSEVEMPLDHALFRWVSRLQPELKFILSGCKAVDRLDTNRK
jgi:hypothetical protein